jgi:hypothetical protein
VTQNNGGPAFPIPQTKFEGMSLRDYFAGQALSGLIVAATTKLGDDGKRITAKDIARDAYGCADELLALRSSKLTDAPERQRG